MTNPPDDLTLPDRLRLAGFELILQGCPAWLYGAVYEAAEIVTATVPVEGSGSAVVAEVRSVDLRERPDA